MINQQDEGLLSKYSDVVKKIIYNPQRMSKFMEMLGTKEGAVTAVHTVVAAVGKLKPIPPTLIPLLGVNAYVLMVDVAKKVTDQDPDPQIMQDVVGQIMAEGQAAQQPAPQQGPPQGMLAQMQEGTAPEGAPPPGMDPQAMPEDDPQAGMLAQMQRRGVTA